MATDPARADRRATLARAKGVEREKRRSEGDGRGGEEGPAREDQCRRAFHLLLLDLEVEGAVRPCACRPTPRSSSHDRCPAKAGPLIGTTSSLSSLGSAETGPVATLSPFPVARARRESLAVTGSLNFRRSSVGDLSTTLPRPATIGRASHGRRRWAPQRSSPPQRTATPKKSALSPSQIRGSSPVPVGFLLSAGSSDARRGKCPRRKPSARRAHVSDPGSYSFGTEIIRCS